MKPTAREVPATIRRTGVHFLRLEIGGQHWTGHESEFAQLATAIGDALKRNSN